MSLSTFMLRVATVQALKGATDAGDRVFDSAISILEENWTKDGPLLVVFTEEETTDLKGLNLLEGKGDLSLVIQCLVGGSPQDAHDVLAIPPTDAGLEAILDMIRYDILVTLQEAETPWAAFWRRVTFGIKTLKMRRGASSERGTRFAVHEMVLSLDTLDEPNPNAPLPEVWTLFLDLIDQTPDLEKIKDPLRKRLGLKEG